MATNTNTKKRGFFAQVGRGLRHFLFGDVVSSQFFLRNKITVVIIVFLFIMYITFKYECQTQMERIAKLQTELTIVKSESIRERSTYKSRTRESTMQQRVDSLHLNLKPQSQPPFVLNY